MRIISGIARGAKLESVDGEETRPTLERVKENFFNAITFELEDAKVLDLFAGSGQLGLEALSRGARECILIDKSAECIEIIRKNAQKAKLYDKCNILKFEYSEYLSSVRKRREFEKFDIVFLDPPYADNARIIKEAVKRLIKYDFLNPRGMIICESENAVELDEESAKRIMNTRVYKYGRVLITVLNIGDIKNIREVKD
jgi:16S rRNA (guanine(966)-N(2))-methyltransferase RsmD